MHEGTMFKSTPFSRRETQVNTIPIPAATFKSTPFSRRETFIRQVLNTLVTRLNPLPSHEGRPRQHDVWTMVWCLNPLPSHEGRQQIFTKNHNAFCPYYPIFSFTNLSNLHSKQSNLLTWSHNPPIIRCESPRDFMKASHSHYIINGSVTSNPGFAPICSTLFLYLSPK